jgi:hypothetical protein
MKCKQHPNYTGKRLGAKAKECPGCRELYYSLHPNKRPEAPPKPPTKAEKKRMAAAAKAKAEQTPKRRRKKLSPEEKDARRKVREALKNDKPIPSDAAPENSAWICVIFPFGKGMRLSKDQSEYLAKSAIRFGKVTGLGYTSFIRGLDYLGMSKTNQVAILEQLRTMRNGITRNVDEQERADRKVRKEKCT